MDIFQGKEVKKIFFFNDTATTEIYTLSLHDALPISRRGISIRHYDEMNDVADHCTVCHKCFSPCPVNIDFGDVSVSMRNLLRNKNKKRSNIGTRLSMMFLNSTEPMWVKLLHHALIALGYPAQRFASQVFNLLTPRHRTPPASTTGKPQVREQVVNFFKTAMPGHMPWQTMRQLLNAEEAGLVPIVRKPQASDIDSEAVFYFPGDRKSTRLNSSHIPLSRMPSSA